MSNVQFGQVLLASLSADKAIRESATQQLENAAKENLALYLELLVTELAKEGSDLQVRQAAGLAIKNALTAKDFQRREAIKGLWFSLDPNSKNGTKQLSLQSLGSADQRVGSTAAQVVAAIAALDLTHGQWNELIPILLGNVTSNPSNNNLKRASLEAIGYICEEIEPNILTAQANQILTAVISGARADQTNEVRLTALSALYNSLEFVRENFNNEGERNYIMQVVCEATQTRDSHVQTAAFEALVKIASLYYHHLQPYMERALFALTVEAMKSEDENVALQAVEFWSTICDEEIELSMEAADAEKLGQKPERESKYFAKIALPHIIPVLTVLLTKQAEEDDDDEWNVAMASGTCISLLANAVGDDIIRFVLPFVEKNIRNPDWRFREASVMAFGSILEAPNPQALRPVVVQALPLLLELLNDQSVQVQDTTAWAIGRICELVTDAIDIQQHLPNLVRGLLMSLQRAPAVAANAAWALVNLAEQFGEDAETPYALSPYFDHIASVLLQTTERPDGEDANLRTGAYETLGSLVQNSSPDNKPSILKVTTVILERLQASIQMQNQLLGVEARLQHSELQANLCALIQNLIRKLEGDVKPYADTLMNLFLQMFASSNLGQNATFLEDALLAVGSLTLTLEKDFIRYMESFLPFLCTGLQNHQEYQVCSISVGLVGDICRALGENVLPYCNTFMTFLLQNLQSPVLHRSVKPPILSTFGDIALAIGVHFVNYFEICMTILQQACGMKALEDDYDLIEYVNQLREGIFEAYTGIVQGMSNAQRILPHTEHMISFIREVHLDQEKSDGVKRGAIGLLGDLSNLLGPQITPLLVRQSWLNDFIISCVEDKNGSTKEVAQWARDMVRKVMH